VAGDAAIRPGLQGLDLGPRFTRCDQTPTRRSRLRALTLSPAVELGFSPSEAFRLGLRFETSRFFARIEGARALQVVGQIALLVGYSF